MLLAGPFILMQKNLKRMLAYSSLEHVGLICAAVGMNAPLTVFGALLHMGCHALTKPVLFFAAGNIHQQLSHPGFPAHRLRAGAHHAGDRPPARPGRGGRVRPAALWPVRQRIDGDCRRLHFASSLGQHRDPGVSLIVVFCGVLNKLSGMLLGPAQRRRPARNHLRPATSRR